jgi:hypothetical protein
VTRRIDTVLRIRRLQERLARAEIAQRRDTLAARERDELAAWTRVHERTSVAPPTAHHFVAHRDMLGRGVQFAVDAGTEVATASGEVELALDRWRAEAQRLDGIERLADRLREAARSEQLRVETLELDDAVITRWPDRLERPA